MVPKMRRHSGGGHAWASRGSALFLVVACGVLGRSGSARYGLHNGSVQQWEAENSIVVLPAHRLGADVARSALQDGPTPGRVRLGRWLFYDSRLSADGTLACVTCHRPHHAFSEPTAVPTGINGQKGYRKSPALINLAGAIYPHFFRDGRAASLEEQALVPIADPSEMGNSHQVMVTTLKRIPGYSPYFIEAFGTADVTKERVAKAIADYVRTRVSGNSPWDRWRRNADNSAMTELAARGHKLFFGKAGCNQCHLGGNFTDSSFHNLGVGWDPETQTFRDTGRYRVTLDPADQGAFKTPTLREVTKHPPYMHDGSISTLRDVILLYNRGGLRNPYLDPRMRPLNLNELEIEALLAFLQSLEGEGYQDTVPRVFPR